jgi:hypothetical protein
MPEYVEENSHRVLDCVDGIFRWEELIHCNLFVFILFICQHGRNIRTGLWLLHLMILV